MANAEMEPARSAALDEKEKEEKEGQRERDAGDGIRNQREAGMSAMRQRKTKSEKKTLTERMVRLQHKLKRCQTLECSSASLE